jgi:hypothetical protein
MRYATKPILLVSLIGLSITIYYGVALRSPLGLNDEGLVLYGASRIADGYIPYRDTWMTGYSPGQFYVLAGLFKVFGPTVLVARLYGMLILSALSVVWFLLAREVLSLNIALLVWLATAIVLIPSASIMPLYPVFPALALGSIGILFLVKAVKRMRRLCLVLAGVCMGLAILFRQDLGLYAFSAGASSLVFTGIRSNLSIRDASQVIILPYILGVAGIVVPSAAFLLTIAPMAVVWEDLFLTPQAIFLKTRHLAYPPLLPTGLKLGDLDDWIGFYFPSFTAILGTTFAFVLLFKSISRRMQNDTHRHLLEIKQVGQRIQEGEPQHYRMATWEFLVFALVPLIALNFLQTLSRTDIIHMIASYIPSMLLATMAVTLSPGSRKGWKVMSARIGLLIFILAPLTIFSIIMMVKAAPSWISVTCLGDRGDETLIQRSFPTCLDQGQVEAARYIVEHTDNNEPIYVGLLRHDKVFVNDNSFYFLAGRHSITRFSILVPGIATTEPVQREIANALESARVRYIVLWQGYGEDYPEVREQPSGSKLLDVYVKEHYRQVERFGQYIVSARWR